MRPSLAALLCLAALALDAAAPVARAQPKQAEWRIDSRDGVFSASSANGEGFTFYLGCNVSRRSFSFSFDNQDYRGKLLERRRDAEKPFILVIRNRAGVSLRFPAILYYTDADQDNSWIQIGNLPSAFLDAFSQGERLTVQTGKGVEAASWALEDAARVSELMRKVCTPLFAASASPKPSPAAPAQRNWGDDNEPFTQGPEFAASKAVCRLLRGLTPPAADRPDAAAAAALTPSCNAEALYYGIGIPADPVKARQCAFIEQDAGEASPYDAGRFGGTAMLMTIYANGVGAARDLDLATALACRVDSAPAEADGRVRHLQRLKAEHWSGHDFSFCDDATSGFVGGLCAAHAAAIADVQRSKRLAELTSAWPATDKSAFAKLRAAERTYVETSAGEVDLSGTLRGALVIEHEQNLEDDFARLLTALAAGKAPSASARDFKGANAELNAVYRRLMSAKDPLFGTVTKSDVRKAQRAWLAYRDAWVQFAAVKYPHLAPDSLRASLTESRAKALRSLTP